MRNLQQLRNQHEAKHPAHTAVSEETFRRLPSHVRRWYAERARQGCRPLTELAARCMVNDFLARGYSHGGWRSVDGWKLRRKPLREYLAIACLAQQPEKVTASHGL